VVAYHLYANTRVSGTTGSTTPRRHSLEHLRPLDTAGCTCIDLPRGLIAVDDATAVRRSASITFDAADAPLLTGGLPHRACGRVPTVVLIRTDLIGGTGHPDGGDPPSERICRDELGGLATDGLLIQAQRLVPRIRRAREDRVDREVRRSKRAFEHHFRRRSLLLCTPPARPAPTRLPPRKMLVEPGQAAFLYGGSCPSPPVGSRHFGLVRIAVGRDNKLDRQLARAETTGCDETDR
jgi:hypothetical protein